MFQAYEGRSLLQAVLGEAGLSDAAAEQHLAEAARRGMEPLDYCAHQFGLGSRVVWQRVAAWLKLVYADELPSNPTPPSPQIDHIDRLGEVRSCRATVVGGEALFIAPSFAQVLRLRAALPSDVRDSLRVTTPQAIEAGLARAASAQLMDNARQRMTVLWPNASAAVTLTLGTRIVFLVALALLAVIAMAAGVLLRPLLIPFVAAILFAPAFLRLGAVLPGKPQPTPPPLGDVDLPCYTVLIPLRDETQMVPGLGRAMAALDYPPHKLDIKFVVEEKSPQTVEAVKRLLDDPRFRLVVVPPGPPNTKPKAIDYALPLARGELIVVYDAEDVPAPDQLRLAAARFAAAPEIACLQAELVPENAHENALTALFAGEYAGLFARLLPALSRWGLPMPLGGTSNHFRIAVLREIGGWDAYNVTEDADLGVRLARRGHRVETLDSITLEEAPLTVRAWMAQRTRWMKGWMQTYIVHTRHPLQLLRDLGWRAFLGFHVMVGGLILTSMLHTIFVGSLLGRLIAEGVPGFVPHDFWGWLAIGILVTGYGSAVMLVTSGLMHFKALHLLSAQMLLPVYWLLHSIAGIYAAIDLLRQPTHWAKTTHGVTRVARGGTLQAPTRSEATLRPRIG